jgi:hypothetical protein
VEKAKFEDFMAQVHESVESFAEKKNYKQKDANPLLAFMVALGINEHHAVAEIIYKMTEYLTAKPATKKVLLEKCCGWCWLMWKENQDSLARHNE